MDARTEAGIEAVRIAATLYEQYRKDAVELGSPGLRSLDDRLLALDQNYAGLWEKLDSAAQLLQEGGLDIGGYREVRERVKDTLLGFKVKHEVRIGLDGIQQRSTFTINKQRLALSAAAIRALQELLPDVPWGAQPDAEVEKFLARQRSPLWVLKLIGRGLVLAAVIAGAVLAYQRLQREPDDSADARTGARIAELEGKLGRQPCSQPDMVALAEALNQAGDHRTALVRSRAFLSKCGEHRRLRWATYAAEKRLGNWDGAIVEATHLIQAVPRDRDYRWWRGVAHEARGDSPRAIEDYQQAIALEPRLQRIPFYLAGLLERTGRRCELLHWVGNFVHHYPENGEARRRLARVTSAPDCLGWLGSGRASIALPEDEDSPIGAVVQVNGGASRHFEVDENALYVMITSAAATSLGVKGSGPARLLLRTPEGFFEGGLTTLEQLSVGKASASRVPALVVDRLPREVEGVVGQSFLTRFRVERDEEQRSLLLEGAAAK